MKIIWWFVFQICICNAGYCQNLSGNWRGWSEKKTTTLNPSFINLELERMTDTTYTGVLHLNYKHNKFEHTRVSGFLNKKNSAFLLVEDSVISYDYGVFGGLCLGKNKLKALYTDSSILLIGIWSDKSRALLNCPNLNVRFEKSLKDHTIELSDNRIGDIQKVIDIHKADADSIKLELYDGGDIDNDSVNLFFNGEKVLNNIRLTANPITHYINLNKTLEINKLSLSAINLGEIPPNTAYLVITFKKRRYAITLSSNFSKDGVVEFQFVD